MNSSQKEYFQKYFALFSNENIEVRIAAWLVTIAILITIIALASKQVRNFIYLFLIDNDSSLRSFQDIEIIYSTKNLIREFKIVVLEGQNSFPVEELSRLGYNIERWNKLDEQKFTLLYNGAYEIVILNHYDFTNSIANEEEYQTLFELSSRNHSLVIVDHLGQLFDPNDKVFLKSSIESTHEKASVIRARKILNRIIKRHFTTNYYLGRIKELLASNNFIYEINKVENLFVISKEKNTEPDWYQELDFLALKHEDRQKLVLILSDLFSCSRSKYSYYPPMPH